VVRIHFGRSISKIILEIGNLEGCIGDNVDHKEVEEYVSEINRRLKERDIGATLILRKAVEWDKQADYRLIVREIKRRSSLP